MRGKNKQRNRGKTQIDKILVEENKYPFPAGIASLADIKYIVIDDLRSHKDQLDGHDGWVFLKTGANALKFFHDYPNVSVKAVYFDHDLGNDDTTRAIASYFEERAYFDNPIDVETIYIHTSNSSGGQWLEKALKAYPRVINVHSDDIGLIYDGLDQVDLPSGMSE